MLNEKVRLDLDEIMRAVGKPFLLRLDPDYIKTSLNGNPAGFLYEISNTENFEAYSWGGVKDITFDNGKPFNEWLVNSIDPADEYAFEPESINVDKSRTLSMKGSLTVFDYLPGCHIPEPLEHKVILLFAEFPKYKTLGDHPPNTVFLDQTNV